MSMLKGLREAESQLKETRKALKETVKQVESDPAAAALLGTPDDKTAAEHPPAKKIGTSRGVETLFRSAYRVQMDLTGLADNKANMMISINGIIISIIIASVAPKLDANPWLLIPTTLFLVGNLVSIVFAILAARPRVRSKPISLDDLRSSHGNILFFGNFANMSEDEFVEGLVDTIQDQEVLYETMIRNVYGLGSVLQKKFALLQIAYNSFMAALILGVSSFIGVFIWIMQQPR